MMTDELAPAEQERFETANRLFFRIYQCANLVHKKGTRAVEPFGATTQQWAVMGALARPQVRARGMAVKDLIAFLQVSRQNLTIVLDRMAERGVIERIADAEDGRSRRIRLTGAGEQVWQAMHGPIAAFYGEALAGLAPAEQRTLIALLDRLRAGLVD